MITQKVFHSDELGITDSIGPTKSFDITEYAARLEKLIARLAKDGLDGAVLTGSVSRLYYTGFESTAGTLLIDAKSGPVFVVDFRYIFMAKKAMPFVKCVLQKSGAASQIEKHTRKWKTCGIEYNESESQCENLRKRLSWIERWEGIDAIVSEQRSIKSKHEQIAMRAAIAANDTLFSWVRPRITPGMTEWDIRLLFRYAADRFGQGEAFQTIVCAGANGAECHHVPDMTPLKPRNPLLMDFGLTLNHYCSDMTRCVSFGKPSALYRKIYNIVLEANRKAIDSIKPGMTGAEVDAIARKHIEKAGYGDAFGHALGHGLGMEVHESPTFSPRETHVIKSGMIITVEPGIYLPGKLGVRIEDVVLVTSKGCECLTTSPRDLD